MRFTDYFLHIDSIHTAFSVTQPEDFTFAGESHGFWEMVYVIDGTVGVTAGSRIVCLDRHGVIFHKPYEFHRIWSAAGSSPTYMVISFDLSGTGTKYFEDLTLKPDEAQREMLDTLARYTAENPPDVSEPLDHAGKSGADFSLFVYTLDRLLCLFAKSAHAVVPTSTDTALLFEKTVKYMEENLARAVSTEEFAAHANVSVSTLKRIFLKYSSLGIHGYFLHMKIQKAKLLLRSGMSVVAVSEALGFSNQNNFSAAFKRAVGVPPSEYAGSSRSRRRPQVFGYSPEE